MAHAHFDDDDASKRSPPLSPDPTIRGEYHANGIEQVLGSSEVVKHVVPLDEKKRDRAFLRRIDAIFFLQMYLGYLVRYLDQTSINNAYVTGMKEGLGINGDEYNVMLTMFTVGYCIGQFPATLLMVKFRPSLWLPTCELLWTVFVFACAGAKNTSYIYAFRFLIGLFEAASYPGGLWVLGSWYTPAELGKRAAIFQSASAAGSMFSGYLATAAYNGLSGTNGLPGWKWIFILDGIISVPIALAGYWTILDTPDRPNPRAFWMRKEDWEYGLLRMERIKRAPTTRFKLSDFKAAARSWVPWVFFVVYTSFVLGLSSYLYMNLWLKADGFSVQQTNLLPTAGYGLQIGASFIYSAVSDKIQMRWPVIAFAGMIAMIGSIVLATWPAGFSVKFMAFMFNFSVVSQGALLLSWANELMSGSAEGRAITIAFLQTSSYVFNAWVPNLAFPASKAPNYPAGYRVTAPFYAITIIGAFVILAFQKRDARKRRRNEPTPTIGEGGQEARANLEKVAPIGPAGAVPVQVWEGKATTT